MFDSSGKQVGTVPNEAQKHYDIHDSHKEAPAGFRLRVNTSVKTCVLVQRQGASVKTIPVGFIVTCFLAVAWCRTETPDWSRPSFRAVCGEVKMSIKRSAQSASRHRS